MAMDKSGGYTDAELFPQNLVEAVTGFYASYEPAQLAMRYRALAGKVGHVRNLFYGDSITAGWPLKEFFPDRSILNRGIGGDNAVGLHVRLTEDVFPYTPERVFMMVGINGIGWPEDLTVARITRVAEEIQSAGSRVWLGSICPLRAPDQWDRCQYQERIVRINGRLQAWAGEHGAGFLDYHAILRGADGQLAENYARPDGTHLLFAAYMRMSELVEPYLA